MKLRKITSLTSLLTFILIVLTSVILYIVPQGRVAYWADWRLWGLTKVQWGNIHIINGLLFLLAMFLKWLDKKWQSEAEMEKAQTEVLAQSGKERIPCWEIHNCPQNLRKNCKAYANPATPCWEVLRTNGNLKPACQTCMVLPPEIPGRIAIA